MVYFLSDGHGNIKIGHCRTELTLKRRIDNLQDGNPNELNLILKISGDFKKEKRLHKQFKKYKIRSEWFRLRRDLLMFVSKKNRSSRGNFRQICRRKIKTI